MWSLSSGSFPFSGSKTKRCAGHPAMGKTHGNSCQRNRNKNQKSGNTYSSFQITSYICPIQVFICNHSTDILPEMINQYLESLPLHEGESEPRYNLFAWQDKQRGFTRLIFHEKNIARPAIRQQEESNC